MNALPFASDDEFVNAPGLGTFKAKHVRRGLERGVIKEHDAGMGLVLVQPAEHGACGFCRGKKGSQPCDHCACKLCSWFRQTDELNSPLVNRERLLQLVARLKAFQIGGLPVSTPSTLDEV